MSCFNNSRWKKKICTDEGLSVSAKMEKIMNPVIHFEMPADERERMAVFYKNVFGWGAQMSGPEMENYVVR